MPLGNASRTANILEHKTPRCSTVSNTPLSSNSYAALKFGNDQITLIFGYGDLVQGTITIKRVYYVEGLNHNLFSVGQLCDADLKVAFRKSTCYIRDLKGNDLLTGSRSTDLYFGIHYSAKLNKLMVMAIEAMQQHVFYLKNRSLVFLDMRKPPYLISSMPETYHVSSDPGPQCSTTVLEQDSLSPGPQSPENVPQVAETVTTSNELELLYSPMFSELLNGTSHVVSKSSGCNAAIT
ncbi:hypothetical protein Tco_1146226 [Tanacetum coccineum]